ncbi:MAG: extracellular solute-binding protein [Blastochloris sp.]|nr:extracellular solute-binding protein [Blastochloris sp.]
MAQHRRSSDSMSRRSFLRGLATASGLAAGSTILAACAGAPATPSANTAPIAATANSDAPAAVATNAPAAVANTTTLVVMYDRNDFKEDQQKAFESANPDITIEFIQQDATRFYAMAAAGNPPDILRVQAPDIPQLLARNLLLDLTPYFEASSVLKLNDLAPANNYYKANSPTEIGSGKQYGMAKDWSPDFTLFANKQVFADANIPVPSTDTALTYAEVADLGAKLKQTDGERVARWGYGYAEEWIDRIWMNMLAEQDLKLYSDDFTSINLYNNDAARAVAQYFFDLAKANIVANPVSPSGWFGDDFTKGTVGLIQYGVLV